MFIPLDSIQVKPTNDKYRNFARGARLAIDVIEFDPQFDAAMQHACGNSLICDTMDVARYVCYDKQQDVKGMSRVPISGFERRDSRSPWATHATASRHARGHRHPQERLHHRWPERPGCRPQVGREGDHQCVRPSAKPQAIADSRGTSAQTSASSATRS
jgi:hypothetical protein